MRKPTEEKTDVDPDDDDDDEGGGDDADYKLRRPVPVESSRR